MTQAENACWDWARKRGYFYYEEKDWSSSGWSWEWKKERVRRCMEESETKQFLGYERSVKDGERFDRNNEYYSRDEVIRRNFRY